MTYPDLFAKKECEKALARIENLTRETQPEWGVMNAAQMLAHLNVAYEFVYDPGKHKRPTGLKKFFLKHLLKPFVVGPKAYKQNAKTAPEFKVASESNAEFDTEKTKLIDFIEQVQRDGVFKFLSVESHSFGLLTEQEWNTLFSKHLEHHLVQFGV